MMTVSFGEAIRWSGAVPHKVDPSRLVSNVTIDSRETGPDSLFVALPGTKSHGHEFVRQVWHKGAVAMVEQTFDETQGPLLIAKSPLEAMDEMMRHCIGERQIQIVGVTGSVGKTSLKELTAAVLRTTYGTGQSRGNYNTAIGLPLSFFSESNGMTHFVAEMGMRQTGEIYHLTQMAPPVVAVITNIGPSHLEQLGSMEKIQQAKGEILQGLVSGGTAVLNYDDPRVRELGEQTPHHVMWYGTHASVDLRVLTARVEGTRTLIDLVHRDSRWHVNLPWIGAHHGHNVAAALLVGMAQGVPLSRGIEGIENVGQDRSRIKTLHLGTVTLLEDVYNASPVSMKAGLDVLSSFAGRKIAVLGDMLELGPAEVSSHFEVGVYAQGRADMILAVGPRSRAVAEGAGNAAHHVDTLEEALGFLQQKLSPGDVVLMKASRGMHFEDLIAKLRDWGGAQ
ncbi:MAG: UDP-N-acetylmuramoyl-tripeptide--D-alanyl-D-alanine ligase [Sulfobacillus sp.]